MAASELSLEEKDDKSVVLAAKEERKEDENKTNNSFKLAKPMDGICAPSEQRPCHVMMFGDEIEQQPRQT